jgi:hypothetical protein
MRSVVRSVDVGLCATKKGKRGKKALRIEEEQSDYKWRKEDKKKERLDVLCFTCCKRVAAEGARKRGSEMQECD